MWWKALVVALSLSLNGAFIAGFAHQAWSHRTAPDGENPDCTCLLRQKIGASDEQWQRIEPGLIRFRCACKETCREINRSRRELIDLIADPGASREAIRAKQEQILAGQRKMQELVVEQLLSAKGELRPEQQKALFDLLKSHCGCDNLMGLDSTPHSAPRQSSREDFDDCCNS
jgi:Spy/CpxP family protein refolding chaperone